MRRSAYQELATTTKQLSRELWQASDLLIDPKSKPADWQAQFNVAHEAWTRFSAAVAAVSIAGPAQASDAADVLRAAMREWDMIVNEWTSAATSSRVGELKLLQERFDAAARSKRPADKAFQMAARHALGFGQRRG